MKSPAPASKYFLYARKSTDDQVHQLLSIPAQIDELREFAQKEGLNIAETFIESKTAKVPGRDIFNQMLVKIEAGEAQGILAWHPDRLARNAVDAGKVVYLLDRDILTDLKFPTFWFQNTPQGLFMLSIAFGQSKYYVDSLSENTKRGLRQKVRKGECPGKAPLGYLNDRLNKKIVVDPKVSPAIKEIFELYSTGKFTFEKLSIFLGEKGIMTSKGKFFKKDKIKFYLSNPFYYGHFRFKKEIYQGIHQPLITKKLFDEVQLVKKAKSRTFPLKSLEFPFTGLIRCGECQMMVTAEHHFRRYETVNHEKDFIYYHCTRKSRFIPCSQAFISQEILVNQLNQHIQKVSLSTSDHQWYIKRLDNDGHQQRSEVLVIVQEFKKEDMNPKNCTTT